MIRVLTFVGTSNDSVTDAVKQAMVDCNKHIATFGIEKDDVLSFTAQTVTQGDSPSEHFFACQHIITLVIDSTPWESDGEVLA